MIRIDDLSVTNVYKPPNLQWSDEVLNVYEHPSIYCGDFNSHSVEWGYEQDDVNGQLIKDWASRQELKLLYDSKDLGTFHSARWNKDYNHDLCFVSANNEGIPLNASRKVSGMLVKWRKQSVLSLRVQLITTVSWPSWSKSPRNTSQGDTGVSISLAGKKTPKGYTTSSRILGINKRPKKSYNPSTPPENLAGQRLLRTYHLRILLAKHGPF